MTNDKPKPNLNLARLTTFGTYRAVYNVECVDLQQKIYRGKPVIEPEQRTLPTSKTLVFGWVYFSREYDDRNDWDRLYHELIFDNESIIGVPFMLVPKEKLLFGYNEPPKEGILIPHVGLQFTKGNN